MCGGRDRFRFLDRQPGDGMWICNQCQPKPRPAIDLAVAYSGRPFREAARVIDDILGDRVVPMVRRERRRRTRQRTSPEPRHAGAAAHLYAVATSSIDTCGAVVLAS